MPTLVSRALGGALLVVLAVGLLSCGGSSGGGPTGPTGPTGPSGTTIGAAGGALSSADGALTVQVPAGALGAATPLTVAQSALAAHGALASYALGPDGQAFAQPVRLVFSYAQADLAGSAADQLLVATRAADGSWPLLPGAVVDPVARTVTVTTTHFSTYSLLRGRQILPAQSTVKVGATKRLDVTTCLEADGPVVPLTPGTFECKIIPVIRPVTWSVQGVEGGNATFGTIAGTGFGATYTAPASAPTPDTVSVTASFASNEGGTVLLVAQVKVAGGGYGGTFTWGAPASPSYANAGMSGTGTVDFVDTCPIDLPCNDFEGPVTVTVVKQEAGGGTCTFAPGQGTGTGHLILDPVGANLYTWFFSASWTATATCTDAQGHVQVADNYPVMVVFSPQPGGVACYTGKDFSFTDPAHLTGAGVACGTGPVTWDFTRR